MKTWSNGKIIDGKNSIDSFNYVLHYASPAVWEGIKSYKQEDGTTIIWKLREHIIRLKDSAKIVGFDIPYSIEEIEEACKKVVEANGNGDLYLRPIAYSNIDAESIHTQDMTKVSLDVYCLPVPPLHLNKEKGIKMSISNIVRSYPQYQMQAKTPANYTAVQTAKQVMRDQKVDDVFVLDNNGYVVEATVANFFIVKGDVILTPPNKGSILPGITRRCVADILNNKPLMFSKYKKVPMVVEKDITKADIYTADCVFLCGTYAEVTRVDVVDGRQIGDGQNYDYFNIIKDEYQKRVRGQK